MKKVKLTEQQARNAVRKWLFEYTSDSGVSHRPSTDDKKAGSIGDDRDDQPSSMIPQEMPIMPMQQAASQLSHALPPIEDPDFRPGSIEELGKAADALSQTIPHEAMEWYYNELIRIREEALAQENKPSDYDEEMDDPGELQKQITPTKGSDDAISESRLTRRWIKMLKKDLNESWYNKPGKMTRKMKTKKLTPQDMKLTRPKDEDQWLHGLESDLSDEEQESFEQAMANVDMSGEVVGGEYVPSRDVLEDAASALEMNPEDVWGYRADIHARPDVMDKEAAGTEFKLRELVDSRVFPNITTQSGMRKLIKSQIDPIVEIWFVANDLSGQMSQFMRSEAGIYIFFSGIAASPLFTDEEVAELKGMHLVGQGIANCFSQRGKKLPAKMWKDISTSSAKVQQYLSLNIGTKKKPMVIGDTEVTVDDAGTPRTTTVNELFSESEALKAGNRESLMNSGLYSEVMGVCVMAPILRRWAKEVKAGNIDIQAGSPQRRRGVRAESQLNWQEAGQWIEDVKQQWNGFSNSTRAGKIQQALQGRMEFLDAMEMARDEAEFAAMP